MKKLFLIILMLFSFIMPACAAKNSDNVLPSETGVVKSVEMFGDATPSPNGEIKQAKQSVEIEVIKGAHKGQKTIVENMLMGNPAYDIILHKGDKVILHVEPSGDGGVNFFIADKQRTDALYFLGGLFIALLLLVGRKKGWFSLVSIVVTLSLIFTGLTPLILHGINPVMATVFICVLSSIVAIYLVGGLNAKSTAAILGTVLSLSIAGMLSVFSIKFASLTGFSNEESLFLFSAHPHLNFVGVLAASMIIGAFGAVMDIGMSIASTVNELYSSNPAMTMRDLFHSGMNVGKDIIGTMANTLILAYLGGALSLVLLSSNIDLQKFFNLNQVATEISSALIGSVAIVLCVPITAIIAAYLIKKRFKPKQEAPLEENDFSGIMGAKSTDLFSDLE